MEVIEAAEQPKATPAESVPTADSKPSGVNEQDARQPAENASTPPPPTNSDVRGRSGSKKSSAKPSSKFDLGPTQAVQSRIKDLFWLELQSRKEIKETLKKGRPGVGEKKSRAVMDTAFLNRFIPGTGLRPGPGLAFVKSQIGSVLTDHDRFPEPRKIRPFAGPGGQPGSGDKSVPESHTQGEREEPEGSKKLEGSGEF